MDELDLLNSLCVLSDQCIAWFLATITVCPFVIIGHLSEAENKNVDDLQYQVALKCCEICITLMILPLIIGTICGISLTRTMVAEFIAKFVEHHGAIKIVFGFVFTIALRIILFLWESHSNKNNMFECVTTLNHSADTEMITEPIKKKNKSRRRNKSKNRNKRDSEKSIELLEV